MVGFDKRRQKRLVALLLAFLVAVLAGFQTERISNPNALVQNQPGLYEVEEVVDGDTIIVNMNGTREIVRMIGVDTPETHHPSRPVECYGSQASQYTRQLIGKEPVRLEADPLETNRDRYDRLLRYVYLPDGTLVERKIIENGYGFAYPFFPFEKSDEFVAYERQSEAAGKGLWSACKVTIEENGSKHTNPASQ
ncbi:MAG: thermonuclease family protein [Candidatus Saccharimonadales bacterium]